MIILLVFEQFDEDTSVMHVFFTVRETNAWFIFVNCSYYMMRFVHYLSLFWLAQACDQNLLFHLYPDFSDFRYSHKRQMNNSSGSIALI